MKFKTCTALVTPFDKTGKVDFEALTKLIKSQIESKIDAILLLGTTGESPTVNFNEREQIIKFCIEKINKQCLVFVGCGSNSTDNAVKLVKQAKKLGADAAVIVTPFYNKCTQKGLFEHYKTINDKCKFPFIVYNVPSRTGLNLEPETLTQLEQLSQMIGLKEASGDVNYILNILDRHTKPVYSGNDKYNHLFLTHGGDGCISVLSNAYPDAIVKQWQNYTSSYNQHKKYFELNNLLFCEVNPIPIKFLLHEIGMCENIVRQPLTRLSLNNQSKILNAVEKLNNKSNNNEILKNKKN